MSLDRFTQIDGGTQFLILKDLAHINDKVLLILAGRETNHRVASPCYITPSVDIGTGIVRRDGLPLTDESGQFQYYIRVREALETAISTGRIPREIMPQVAPDYVRNLQE